MCVCACACVCVCACVCACVRVCMCLEAYFWTYDAEKGKCVQRADTTMAGAEDGSGSLLWSVWSWMSELTVFLVVPLIILIFNVLVIRELRALDRHSPTSRSGRDSPAATVTVTTAAVPPSCKHQVRSGCNQGRRSWGLRVLTPFPENM